MYLWGTQLGDFWGQEFTFIIRSVSEGLTQLVRDTNYGIISAIFRVGIKITYSVLSTFVETKDNRGPSLEVFTSINS